MADARGGAGVTDLVGAVVKGVFGIIGGVAGGVARIIGGIFSLNGGLIVKGLGDIASSILGALIVFVLRVAALVQQAIPFQARRRRMTSDEINDLKRIFGGSLAFYNIRIVEGRAGIFLGPRELVTGNTIYMKGHDPETERERLAHECVHVWQYQNRGSRYTSDALYAQWFVDDEYSWEKELERGKEEWVEFNPEAQGKLIQDVYFEGQLVGAGALPGSSTTRLPRCVQTLERQCSRSSSSRVSNSGSSRNPSTNTKGRVRCGVEPLPQIS